MHINPSAFASKKTATLQNFQFLHQRGFKLFPGAVKDSFFDAVAGEMTTTMSDWFPIDNHLDNGCQEDIGKVFQSNFSFFMTLLLVKTKDTGHRMYKPASETVFDAFKEAVAELKKQGLANKNHNIHLARGASVLRSKKKVQRQSR